MTKTHTTTAKAPRVKCSVLSHGTLDGKRLYRDECPDCARNAGKAPRWGLVEYDGKWLVGFDGGGRPIWAFNRLRAGIFNHSEISQEFSRADKNKLTFIEVNTKA